jgi:hypothetical protein
MKFFLILTFLFICFAQNYNKTGFIPVYMMMPLNLVTNRNTVNNKPKLIQQLTLLKEKSVEGIMIDVWWGIVVYYFYNSLGIKTKSNVSF